MAGWAQAISERLSLRATWPVLDPDPGKIISQLVKKVPQALDLGRRHRAVLRRFAVEAHDWKKIAATWFRALRQMN